MNYKADYELFDIIDQYKSKLRNNVLFGIVLFLGGSFLILHTVQLIIDFKYILGEALFLATMMYMQYSQIVPNGNIVNHVAVELNLDEDKIVVITSGFKVLFWFNKASRTLIFDRNHFNINKNPKVIKHLFGHESGVVKLSDKDKYAFVIFDYFNKDLEKLLERKDISIIS